MRCTSPGVSLSLTGSPSRETVPSTGCGRVDHHLPMPDLGMVQRAVHRVDRAGRNAGFVEELLPLVDRPRLQLLVDQLRQGQPILVAVAVGLEPRIVQPLLGVEQLAELRPPLFPGRARA